MVGTQLEETQTLGVEKPLAHPGSIQVLMIDPESAFGL
jgi:hypothetical protein